MRNLQFADNNFFEEYKQLDKLCSEIYSCQNGVSEYIAQMENKSYQGQFRIPSWDSDYKMLKHVRWVRNQIAHDSGVYQISEPEDLEFVQDYRNRIFSGQDSLTLLRKSLDAEAEQKRQWNRQRREQEKVASSPIHTSQIYIQPKKKSRKWIGFLVGIGVLMLVIILLYLSR